jgi:hypothetical protein
VRASGEVAQEIACSCIRHGVTQPAHSAVPAVRCSPRAAGLALWMGCCPVHSWSWHQSTGDSHQHISILFIWPLWSVVVLCVTYGCSTFWRLEPRTELSHRLGASCGCWAPVAPMATVAPMVTCGPCGLCGTNGHLWPLWLPWPLFATDWMDAAFIWPLRLSDRMLICLCGCVCWVATASGWSWPLGAAAALQRCHFRPGHIVTSQTWMSRAQLPREKVASGAACCSQGLCWPGCCCTYRSWACSSARACLMKSLARQLLPHEPVPSEL